MIDALLFVAAAGVQSPAPSFPLAEVLDEARNACAPGALPAAGAGAAGWVPLDLESAPWLAGYVARHSEGGGMKVTSRTFAKTVAGRKLVAFVAHIRLSFAPDAPGFSCEIFDPEAPAVTAKEIVAWADRAPKSASGPGSEIVFASWDPGLGRGVDETTVTWMSASVAASAEVPRGLRFGAIGKSGAKH